MVHVITSAMLRKVFVTVGLPLEPTAMSACTVSLSMRTSTVARSMPALQKANIHQSETFTQ